MINVIIPRMSVMQLSIISLSSDIRNPYNWILFGEAVFTVLFIYWHFGHVVIVIGKAG